MGLLRHSAGLGEIRAPAPWDPFADIPDPAFAECAGFGRAVPDCSWHFFFRALLVKAPPASPAGSPGRAGAGSSPAAARICCRCRAGRSREGGTWPGGHGQPNGHKVAIELKPLFEGFKFKDLAVQRKSPRAVGFSESHFHRTLSKYSLEACCAPCLVYLLGSSCCMQEKPAGKPFCRAEERSTHRGW